MRRFTWLMLLLLMSCQQAVQPPTIRYGEDACANCRMLINEAPYACAIETEAGEVRKYDDFNCMFLDSERVKPMRYWVHHHDKPDQWLDGEKAFYVRADALQTPMGSRTLAVATREEADRKAKQLKGKVFPFEAVRRQFLSPK
jgi:nitrous oxide reductase accessory protein NosL